MTNKKFVVIHHTVTSPGTGKRMTDYHLVLDYFDGVVKIYEHHPPDYVTRHAVGGANSISYSVALVGNFVESPVPGLLFDGLVHALAVKMRRGEIPRQIFGHCDIGKTVKRPYSTQCPGALHSMIPELRQRIARYL